MVYCKFGDFIGLKRGLEIETGTLVANRTPDLGRDHHDTDMNHSFTVRRHGTALVDHPIEGFSRSGEMAGLVELSGCELQISKINGVLDCRIQCNAQSQSIGLIA